jgi:hypothetical protein
MPKKRTESVVNEDSIAMATLHPDSRPAGDDPKSKHSHIASMIGAMHAMSKDDLVKWYDDAMALIGKEASHLPGHANEKSNEDSLDMKASHAVGKGGASANDPMPKLDHKNNPLASRESMKEDVEEMFVGQELSEEFKDKATTLFEAAVNVRAMAEISRIEEEYESKLEDETAQILESVEKNLNTYLDYVVENWMKENEVAIESALRNEIMGEFIDGLKGLFAEHYIDVPEDKVDVIETMSQKIERLEEALNETISENTELKNVITEAEKTMLIDDLSEGLTVSQAEKFVSLAEGIAFDGNTETFKAKLETIKESYFASTVTQSNSIVEETFETDETEMKTIPVDPSVNRYVQAISRTVKK